MLQKCCKKSGVFGFCNTALQAGNIVLIDVAVNIRGRGDVRVPHQVLRGFEVIALPAEVGAVCVPQKMRRDRRIKCVLDDLVSV